MKFAYGCFNLYNAASRRFLSSAAVQLSHTRYNLVGESASQRDPMVLIHGLFGSKKNWSSLAKVFSKKLCREVVTVDARNHGQSTHTELMDFHMMCEDLESLLCELEISKAIILGHSMGGKIAMTLALTKPHMVSELVVVDVAPTPSRLVGTTLFPHYINAMADCSFDQSLPSLTDARRHIKQQLKATIDDNAVLDFLMTNLHTDQSGMYGWRVNLDAIRENLDKLVAFPQFNTSYSGRTLFIGGGNSTHIRPEHYAEIRRLFPASQIQHIDGAGHWVHSEKPHEFITAVLDFIQNAPH